MARSAPAMDGHHNLPTQATALVGRDREVAELRHLVLSDDGRLVTLARRTDSRDIGRITACLGP